MKFYNFWLLTYWKIDNKILFYLKVNSNCFRDITYEKEFGNVKILTIDWIAAMNHWAVLPLVSCHSQNSLLEGDKTFLKGVSHSRWGEEVKMCTM